MADRDRELLRRWREHPLRDVLRRAHGGAHVFSDSLDRLALPREIRRATEQAIAKVQPDATTGRLQRNWGPGSPDSLSMQLVESLYRSNPNWETPDERRHRQAAEGDPQALAEIKAEEEGTRRLVDKIMGYDHD